MASTSQARIDLMRENGEEYALAREPHILSVKPARYLAIQGRGAPDREAFQRAVSALYGVAYTLKMASKRAGSDFKVMPLEGLWWGKQPNTDFTSEPRERWNWKLLIRVPELVAERDVAAAQARLVERGRGEGTDGVKLERISEGQCVQALHTGPYADERATIGRMLEKTGEAGLTFHGLHHEIYLSDSRRTAPERLRTLLRHPVKAAR